jgi:hypothetical protein
MKPWDVWVKMHQAESSIVVIPASELEIDQSINRPVLVSVNLAGSDPDWKIEIAPSH